MHATPMRFSGFIRPHTEWKGEGDREGSMSTFCQPKIVKCTKFQASHIYVDAVWKFFNYICTTSHTHTHTNTQANIYVCGCGIENTLYALWLCENSFNLKQIRNDNNDEIISYQHAKSERETVENRERKRERQK